jgi:hypothetical protein
MGQEISIKLSVESAQALANLTTFLNNAENGLKQLSKPKVTEGLVDGANAWTASLTKNRMALMELGHTARATADIMIMGGGTRMLAAQVPQMIQAFTLMGVSLSTLGSVLGVVGLAAGAGYLVWREYTSATREAEKASKDLHTQMEGVAKIFKQIQDYGKAGLLSPAAINKNIDLLTGKTSLYRSGADGSLTTSPSYQRPETKTLYNFGTGLESTIQTGRMLTIQNEKASALEVQKYILDNLKVEGKLDELQVEASVKLRKLKEEMATQSLTDAEKEKQQIHLKYQAERDEAQKLSAEMGTLMTAKGQVEVDALVSQSKQNEILDQQAVDMKVRDAERLKSIDAFNKGNAAFAKQYADQNYILERQITQHVSDESVNRSDAIQYEYNTRMDFEESMLLQGIIGEEQYTKAVEDATAKKLVAENQLHDAKVRALDDVIAQQRAEKERAIRESPFLTDQQKYNQLKAGGYNDHTTYQGDPSSYAQQFAIQVVKIQSQWGSAAKQMAQTFASVFNSAISSISNGITGLIMGTKTWGQALLQIGSDILTTIISAIVRMAVTWIANQVMMAVAGKTIQAAAVAATAPIAAAASAIWAVPATLATIASYGAAATAAPGFIALAEGITMAESIPAMERGGDVQAGRPYIVGERRPEYFVPNENGHIYPYVPNGRAGGAAGAESPSRSSVTVQSHYWTDYKAMLRAIASQPEFDHHVMDAVNKKSFTIRRRGE